jgi:hypothetical protein
MCTSISYEKRAAGEDAGRYSYFKIGDKFRKYF